MNWMNYAMAMEPRRRNENEKLLELAAFSLR